jgi:hypothetical protein
MTVRLLSSGVDSLYLSASGGLRVDLLAALEAAQAKAQHEGEEVPVVFEREPWRLLLRPRGYLGYRYWLTSREVEVWLGRAMEGPAARVQLHSAFLHAAGTEEALTAVEGLLDEELFTWEPGLTVSRVDVYVDVQGWRPVPADLGRFVSKANHRELHVVGREFTGFVFGRTGGVRARVYDKTAQMREAGLTWMRSYWRDYAEGEPVWRVEFQVRGPLLRRLRSREASAVLASVPGLWRYCAGSWLTLRLPSAHAVRARWPVDPVWVEVQGLAVEHGGSGELVWREVEAASEERVLAVLQGAWSSWAAMWGLEDPERAARALVLRVGRYLAKKDRTFAGEVRRKRGRLAVRGVRRAVLGRHLRPGPKAREERTVPRIGRSARTARRARVGQSTFLGRPPKDTTEMDSGKDRKLSAEGVSGGDSRRGWLEAETSGEAVDRRGDGGRGDAARRETGRPRGTEGERQYAGEGVRAHERGLEDDGARRGDGVGRAMAAVGAEPPSQPEGSEPNLAGAGRRSGSGGRERRRRRVRDGGDGGGCARQGTERTGRVRDGGRGLSKRRRWRGRSASVSLRPRGGRER